MIPTYAINPAIEDPLPDTGLPEPDEISEEGFGGFRGTWFIGDVPIDEAIEVLDEEAAIIAWLDIVAQDEAEFEILATTIETRDVVGLPEDLRTRAEAAGLAEFVGDVDDFPPLGALEVGVAALSYALGAAGCLTAASCRSHDGDQSWSDCPVVFFAVPAAERLACIAGLAAASGCGVGSDRGLLTIYAPSIVEMHRLARAITSQHGRRPG